MNLSFVGIRYLFSVKNLRFYLMMELGENGVFHLKQKVVISQFQLEMFDWNVLNSPDKMQHGCCCKSISSCKSYNNITSVLFVSH